MEIHNIPDLRLQNQGISLPVFEKTEDVVNWLGAVQAQDYFGAKWSLGLRMQNATDKEIDQAFNDGSILRTHVLRPTWHFVTPKDIRWLLELTAPQIHKLNAYMYRNHELDQTIFKRSNTALAMALQGSNYLTRDELRDVLHKAGIDADNGVRMSYLMMYAELDGIVCSGPRRGKQFTYALLDERVPQSGRISREDALAELARRYFTSRGPATVQDFAKWSSLMVADGKGGLEAVKANFQHETLDGKTYWFAEKIPSKHSDSPIAYLLSVYDEYISGYKDRSAMAGEELTRQFNAMGNALQYIMIVDGRFAGTWKRTLKKDAVIIQLNPLIKFTSSENEAITTAVKNYGAFLNLLVVLESR